MVQYQSNRLRPVMGPIIAGEQTRSRLHSLSWTENMFTVQQIVETYCKFNKRFT